MNQGDQVNHGNRRGGLALRTRHGAFGVALVRTVVSLSAVFLGLAASASRAAVLSQGFGSVSTLSAAGWKFSNQSDSPGTGWSQGTTGTTASTNGVGSAADGPATSYIFSSYKASSSTARNLTLSNWMVTPQLAFGGVDHTMTFKTRTETGAPYPDRLEVRLSSANNNTGTSTTDVGDFSSVLLTINPNLQNGTAYYPDTWTTYTATIAGSSVPTNGYIAFRYYVTDGGGNGSNSDIIGIDTLNIAPAAVPEPTSIAAIGLAGAGLLGRRRRA